MKNGSPFGIGGLWENWKDPTSGEWMRTFAIITTDANELVAQIHDRMPLILVPADYSRWLSDEPYPGDLMRPFPAEPSDISQGKPVIAQAPARSTIVTLRLHLGTSRTSFRSRISAHGGQGGRGCEIQLPRSFPHAAARLRVQARQ
jgi:hypothetical protein